jgi:hypothetical protein
MPLPNPLPEILGGLSGAVGSGQVSITPSEVGQAVEGAGGVNDAAGAAAAGSAVSSSVDAFVKAWNSITSRALWIRIAEGILGIGLIFVAVLDMTGAKNAAELATKVVR